MLRNISLNTANSNSSQTFILKNNTNFCTFVFSLAGLGT